LIAVALYDHFKNIDAHENKRRNLQRDKHGEWSAKRAPTKKLRLTPKKEKDLRTKQPRHQEKEKGSVRRKR